MDQSLAFFCESRVAEIIAQQAHHGVNFDSRKAKWLIHQLTEEILEIDREAIPQLPMMRKEADTFKKPFLKSGKLAKWPSVYCEDKGLDPSYIAAPFTRVWYEPFDMGKTDKLKRVMIDHGWIPTEWNTKSLDKDIAEAAKKRGVQRELVLAEYVDGYVTKNFIEEPSQQFKTMLLEELRYNGPRNRRSITSFLLKQRFLPTTPKLTEDSFDTIKGTIGELVKRRVQLSHRRSLLEGLLKHVRSDGKLEAGANSCATPTYRMRHRVVVNIPAARSVYGKEIRALFIGDRDTSCRSRVVDRSFIPRDQWDFVGYDGAGLELRMLAHYMNDPLYTHQILEGDIHTYNQTMAGLPTRDDAKTFIYAFIYGGGDAKLGELVNGGQREGKLIRSKFLSELPALDQLIKRTKKEAKKGYLLGLDGRKITLRRGYDGEVQLHKALNTRLQCAGAVVMKYAMVFLDHWVKKDSLRAYKVLDMHDEGQWTCHPEDTPKLRYYMDNCVRVAGEYLNMNCPLASDSMIGANWYHTH